MQTINKMGLLVAMTAALSTLIVLPTITYDPINIPKMSVVAIGSFATIPYIFHLRRDFLRIDKKILALFAIFAFALIINIFLSPGAFSQRFWGTWGRSNGFLSYWSCFLALISASIYSSKVAINTFFSIFLRSSYIVSSYAFLQLLKLDPVSWSAQEPFSTLGNINFMSAFLGLACALLIVFISESDRVWHERLFFFSVTCFNIWIIITSGSIQGIAIVLTAMVIVFTIKIYSSKGLFGGMTFLTGSSIIGGFVLIGTLGLGPLRALVQATALYRSDYWRAGWDMFKSNWFFGVGLDSYGDYYRQYRDLLATVRTGPQRTTNTAHNIFLDLLANGGILLGGSFLILCTYVILRLGYLITKDKGKSPELVRIMTLVFSSMIFYLISINQIGVGFWGFIFLGLAIGVCTRHSIPLAISQREKALKDKSITGGKKPKFDRVGSSESKDSEFAKMPNVFLVLLFGVIGGVLALPPLLSDHKMLNGLRNNDLVTIKLAAGTIGSSEFYREKYLDMLVKSGMEREAHAYAQQMFENNPRSFPALIFIALSSVSSDGEREDALKLLVNLDPMSASLPLEIKEQWKLNSGS